MNFGDWFVAFAIDDYSQIPDQNLSFRSVAVESTFCELLGNILWILMMDLQHLPSFISFRFKITISDMEIHLLIPHFWKKWETYPENWLWIYGISPLNSFRFQIAMSVLKMFLLSPPSWNNLETHPGFWLLIRTMCHHCFHSDFRSQSMYWKCFSRIHLLATIANHILKSLW